MEVAPYNGNFGAAPAVQDNFGTDAFNDAPRRSDGDYGPFGSDISGLQTALKKFGLLREPANGKLDEATRAALRTLALITGMPTASTASANAALNTAEDRAARMLWILNVFPFGTSLPSWLLASLDNSDISRITRAFNTRAAHGTPVFSVRTPAGLVVHGRLVPDDTDQNCFGYSALFERGSLQHHVISRACRISADQWATAERN